MTSGRCLLVTGRLAEPALREVLASMPAVNGLELEIAVLPISVAALMHAEWVSRKLTVGSDITRVILPGWCQGDLAALQRQFQVPVELGPKELLDLPEYLGRGSRPTPDLSRYDIQILAEINHAPRLSLPELRQQAEHYRASGADVIDLGCIPGESWKQAGEATRMLRDLGLSVSIDSFDRAEVEASVTSGAELVLSCNRSNLDWAASLPVELVVIPDDPRDLTTLEPTLETLRHRGARFRLDPILEPIGFGFAASLDRYLECRRRWPELPIMMGVGNVTELTEVDSAGVNLLLAAFCQELKISSVLTTQVAPWCRTSVQELDIARRIVAHAVGNRSLPKRVDSRLLLLRDSKRRELGDEALARLALQLKDPNFRIFAEGGRLHIMNRDGHRQGTDPFTLFEQLGELEPAHAFYLGYELAKAVTALTLDKAYRQDDALDWGFLTRPEISALHRRQAAPPPSPPQDELPQPPPEAQG